VDSTPTCQRHVLKSIEVPVTIEMNRDIPSPRSKDFDVIRGHEIERVQEHKYMLHIHQGRVGKTKKQSHMSRPTGSFKNRT
jgi:hypothetical protein